MIYYLQWWLNHFHCDEFYVRVSNYYGQTYFPIRRLELHHRPEKLRLKRTLEIFAYLSGCRHFSSNFGCIWGKISAGTWKKKKTWKINIFYDQYVNSRSCYYYISIKENIKLSLSSFIELSLILVRACVRRWSTELKMETLR